MIRLLLISIALIYSFENTRAGTIDPDTPDNKYLEYAQSFHVIGRLCGDYEDKTSFCASAVAIDNYHILTAAHVVNNSKSCYLHINSKKICVTNFVINKDFESDFGTADIAIGYCDESINLKSYPQLYSKRDEIDKICSISGYGLYGTFNSGAKSSDNKRRAGSNKVDYITANLLVCNPSKRSDKDFTELEFMIASGDSGGGLFIDGKLAGINSCIMSVGRSPKSSYENESGHTRISSFVDWIEKNKKKPSRKD